MLLKTAQVTSTGIMKQQVPDASDHAYTIVPFLSTLDKDKSDIHLWLLKETIMKQVSLQIKVLSLDCRHIENPQNLGLEQLRLRLHYLSARAALWAETERV